MSRNKKSDRKRHWFPPYSGNGGFVPGWGTRKRSESHKPRNPPRSKSQKLLQHNLDAFKDVVYVNTRPDYKTKCDFDMCF